MFGSPYDTHHSKMGLIINSPDFWKLPHPCKVPGGHGGYLGNDHICTCESLQKDILIIYPRQTRMKILDHRPSEQPMHATI